MSHHYHIFEKLSIDRIRTKTTQLFKDIYESITGTERDFTTESLGKAILLLAVPMVLEMVMESVFAIVDIYFVSRLGAEAVATVGITESLITIVYAIGIGLATGTTALVARRIGEKRPKEASKTAFQAIIAGVMISIIIAIPGVIFASDLLLLMNASPQMAGELSGYTRIMLAGNGIIILLFVINAVFRSSGDAAISMRVLWMANIINLVLDPCLILGLGPFPEMGIEGAAIATNIGRGIAVIYQFYLLFYGRRKVKLFWKSVKIRLSLIFKIIKLSLGGIGQMIIATTSWIGLVRIISEFGSDVIAGYTIAIRVVLFVLLPAAGIANAASTLVGQNLGAKRPDRAEKSVWATGKVNSVLLGLVGILFIIIPGFFIRLFIQEEEVVEAGIKGLRIISMGFFFYGLGMVLMNAFNGAGDTITPTKLNFFCFWLLEIPLAYLLSIPFGLNETGVFIAIVFAEMTLTISALCLFKKGKWKLKLV